MRKIVFTALLAILCLSAEAQQPKRPQFTPEEFRNRLEQHITRKAELTTAEAEQFFPLFHEMKTKQRELTRKAHELKRNPPAPNANDEEYSRVVQEIAKAESEAAEIGVTYYKRLCKALSPKKVYQALLADDTFHRKMLRDFRSPQQQGKKAHRQSHPQGKGTE